MAVFDKASLVMIPSQYKEGKVYNIKPEDQSSSFEFERGSAATRVNSDGLIETLHDEATNLLLQSNQFDTTWSISSANLTEGQSGYDGSSDAWLLSKTGSGGSITQTVSTSGVQTVSFYAKADTDNWVRITIGSVGTSFFDLTNGVFGVDQSISSNSVSLGNGWYRVSCTFNGSGTYVQLFVADGDNDISGTSGSIYIQDAQLESGYFATPYIETTTQTVTRPNRHDTPRLDYSGTEPALLLEPQRTNLFPNSENLNSVSSYFELYDNSVGFNSFEGTDTTNTGYDRYEATLTNSTSGDATISFLLKKKSSQDNAFAGFKISPQGQPDRYGYVDAYTGNFAVSTGTTELSMNVESYNNDWWKVTGTRDTLGLDIRFGIWPALTSTLGGNEASATGSNVFALIQVEIGSYATSYIPTNGQTETRLADVCQGGGDASVFNDAEGVFYFEGSLTKGDISQSEISISDGTSLNAIRVIFLESLGVWFYIQGQVDYRSGINVYNNNKIAFKYKNNDCSFWINGIKLSSDTSATIPTGLNQLNLNNGNLGNPFKGNVKALHYFPEALTDTELQQLTTI